MLLFQRSKCVVTIDGRSQTDLYYQSRKRPIEEILKFIRARPFVPFRIHLLDGRTFDVHHPELVMPGARTVIVGSNADPALPYFEPGRHEVVSLLAIGSLELVSISCMMSTIKSFQNRPASGRLGNSRRKEAESVSASGRMQMAAN